MRHLGKFLCIFLVFVSREICSGKELSKVKRAVSPRIIGGDTADERGHPWLATVHYKGEYYCGGTIISKDAILTSATCVEEDPEQEEGTFMVKVGNYRIAQKDEYEQSVKVKRVIVHFAYKKYTKGNDLAILKLEKSLEINERVKRVKIPEPWKEEQLIERNMCMIAGFGVYDCSPAPNYPWVLKETSVQIRDEDECEDLFPEVEDDLFEDRILCALTMNSGPCDGDGGNPLMCYDQSGDAYMVGVQSFIAADCWWGGSGYSRVTKASRWITRYR